MVEVNDMKEIQEDVAEIRADVKVIKEALFSDIDRPGLIARVKANEDKMGIAGKMLFAAYTAILGLIVSIFKLKGA